MPALLALLQAVGGESSAPALVDRSLLPPSMGVFVTATIVKLIFFFTMYMITVAYLTLAERKISAWIQDRHGPNRVGPKGLFQPLADGLKNIMKEETYPAAASKAVFVMAPIMTFTPALLAWAVIPFAAPWGSRWGLIEIVLADLPIGFLYILAITSLGVYGIVLAGWASNNKYSLLGGLRSSAQMVSYEVALGMSLIPVLLLAGNVTLDGIIAQQQATLWNVANLTVAFFVFIVAAFAETNRVPFDLPEAESELIAGYHTEYSAMKFSMFFIGEYANVLTASALMATLFLGGWDVPIWQGDGRAPFHLWETLLTFLVFMAKTFFFVFLFMWVRWTLPRFRYDQLMSLGWKFMIPVALAYIVIIAGAVLVLDMLGIERNWLFGLILFAVNLVLVLLLFVLLDRGRLISPATARVPDEELARLRARGRPAMVAPQAGD